MGPVRQAIIDIVNQVPRGYVVSYGQIAALVQESTGQRVTAQLVGWQLSGMKKHERNYLPWRRVVNKQGYISSIKLGDKGWIQADLLEKDGIEIENNTVLDMEEVRWNFESEGK